VSAGVASGHVRSVSDTGSLMARRTYTDEQKAEALALYVEHGAAEAARQCGVAKGTIQSWASRAGVATHATENLLLATEQKLADMAKRKAQLASDLLDDIARLRAQLFAPCCERKVVTLGGGMHSSATWEIVDVEHDRPSFADQKACMTSIAIAVDKVQILTGEATERIDHRHSTPVDDELARLAEQLEHVPEQHQP
jgi:transposase-like protein